MGAGFPDSFSPTNRDYALTAGLLTANPFNTGRQYQDDWGSWKASVADRLTVYGVTEMAATSAAFFGISRFLMPRITRGINQLGVRGFLLPLLLSSTALSMVTSALMTTWQRYKYDQFAQGQGAVQQWATGLLYSIPSSMLGMGGSQVFRNISHLLRFDIGTEGVQALASAGIGSTLESTGLQSKRNLTTGQRIAQEFVEGVMYFGVGRTVGGAIPRMTARLQQSYRNPACEVGAVGLDIGIPGRPDLPPGIDLNKPPWLIPPWIDPALAPIYYPKRFDVDKSSNAGKESARVLREVVRRSRPLNPRWDERYGSIAEGLRHFIYGATGDWRLQRELRERLLVGGLGEGCRPHDRVPYVCPIPFDVTRARNGVRFDPNASPYFDPVIDGDTPHVIFDTQAAVRLLQDGALPLRTANAVRRMITYDLDEAAAMIDDRPIPAGVTAKIRGLFAVDEPEARSLLSDSSLPERLRNLSALDAEIVIRLLDDPELPPKMVGKLTKLISFDMKGAARLAADQTLPVPLARKIDNLVGFNAKVAGDLLDIPFPAAVGQRVRQLFTIDVEGAKEFLKTHGENLYSGELDVINALRSSNPDPAIRLLANRYAPNDLKQAVQKMILFDSDAARALLAEKLLQPRSAAKVRKLLAFDSNAARRLLTHEPLSASDAKALRKLLLFDAEQAVGLLEDRKIDRQLADRIKKIFAFDQEGAKRLLESGELPDYVVRHIRSLKGAKGKFDSKVAVALLRQGGIPQKLAGKIQQLMGLDTQKAAALLADPQLPRQIASKIRRLTRLDAEGATALIASGKLGHNAAELARTMLLECGLMKDSITPRLTSVNTTEATHEALPQAAAGNRSLPPEWRCLRGEVGAYQGWKFLKEMIDRHGGQIYLRVYEWDDYGRPVSEVLVKKGPNFDKSSPLYDSIREVTLADDADPYINLNLAMVESGWGHAYFVTPDSSGNLVHFRYAEDRARAAGRGLWADPHFKDAQLFVTSNHSYKHHNPDDPRHVDYKRDKPTAANSEYMRAFNISGQRMNLRGYKIRNGDFEVEIKHNFILEAGQGVMILTHASKHPADRFDRSGRYKTAQCSWNDRAETFIDLKLDVDPRTNRRVKDETINYWDEDLPLELVAPDGKVLCMDVASQSAFEKLPPEFKRLRGAHF